MKKLLFTIIMFMFLVPVHSQDVVYMREISVDTVIECDLGNTMIGMLVADYEVDMTLTDIRVRMSATVTKGIMDVDVAVLQGNREISKNSFPAVVLREAHSDTDYAYTITVNDWNVVMLSHNTTPYMLGTELPCASMLLFY